MRPWVRRLGTVGGVVAIAGLAMGARCAPEATPPPGPPDETRAPYEVTLGPQPEADPDLAALVRAEQAKQGGGAPGPDDGATDGSPARPDPDPDPTPPTAAAIDVVVLPPPPFSRVRKVSRPDERPRLWFEREQQSRGMVEPQVWRAQHDLSSPAQTVDAGAPPGIPATLGGQPLRRILYGVTDVLVYRGDPRRAPILAGWDRAAGRFTFAFDFAAWSRPPQVRPGDEAFVDMDIGWAQVAGDRLYVSHFHRTHSASSMGANGFIVALRVPDGTVEFSSEPRVANSATFEVIGGLVITGYGFTSEPDYVYALSALDGETLARTRVHTAPEDLAVRGNQVLVRAYDRTYELRLRGMRGGGTRRTPRSRRPAPAPRPQRPPPVDRAPAPTRVPDPVSPPDTGPETPAEPSAPNPCAPFGVPEEDPDTGRIRCVPRGVGSRPG